MEHEQPGQRVADEWGGLPLPFSYTGPVSEEREHGLEVEDWPNDGSHTRLHEVIGLAPPRLLRISVTRPSRPGFGYQGYVKVHDERLLLLGRKPLFSVEPWTTLEDELGLSIFAQEMTLSIEPWAEGEDVDPGRR